MFSGDDKMFDSLNPKHMILLCALAAACARTPAPVTAEDIEPTEGSDNTVQAEPELTLPEDAFQFS